MVDKAIADDTDQRCRDRAEDSGTVDRQRRDHVIDHLAGERHVGDKKAEVDRRGKADHQQRSVAAKLRAALHHLRNADARPLRRGQRQKQPAKQMTSDNRRDRRENIEMVSLGRDGAGHHRQRRDIGAEPQSEQAARLTVPLVFRHVVYRFIFYHVVLRHFYPPHWGFLFCDV